MEELERESQGIDYFARSEPAMFQAFLDHHPRQDTSNAVVMRVFTCKDGTSRKWLTYSKERHLLFCFVCLAFSRKTDTSAFITGMNDWRHVHLRTEEHEKSTAHQTCAEAFFLRCSKSNICSLFTGSQMSAHREHVKKRSQVLERVVDVVKVLGKRGLSYRHVENEAAYTLNDYTIDHGNFLELIVLLGKYDICLREHLDDCVEKSRKMHQSSGSRGRGSLITLLSKTTDNSVIDALGHLIQESIARDVQKAGMFSVQLDTTQDINGHDQCSVILRYVTEAVQERLVAMYLQSEGMDILSAHRMVTTTQESLKSIARDFSSVKSAADTFVKWANEQLEEREDNTDMEVEAALPAKRAKKRKSRAGEMAQVEVPINAEKAYEVKVHNIILDTAIEAIHRRFATHGTLLTDLAWLDPRKFDQVRTITLPSNALQNLNTCLLKFDSRATVNNLQSELKSFAGQWDRLKASHVDEYKTRTAEDGSEEGQEESEIVTKSCGSCKNCPLCCYQILRRFNMLSDAYRLLGLAYKYLLTLSLTQVACERTFSTLKFIKSRLRSSLSANKLEMFMLMATEKDILMSFDTDMVIDRVAEKSELLRKLLL
ncbi:hypothetical protein GJAV_G00116060 [Gymnothorax javanicus]|nr:hypothetical protein GJAV_G00116060 [Gymnothorax javanicus]